MMDNIKKKLQLRTDHKALPISEETINQQQIEHYVPKSATHTDQLTTELLKQAFIEGMKLGQSLEYPELKKIQCEMQSIKRDVREIKHSTQETQQTLKEFVQGEEQRDWQTEQRDQKLLRRVEFIRTVSMFIKRRIKKLAPIVESTHKYIKRILCVLLGGTIFGDVMIDFFVKEVGKKMVSEERFEAMANEGKRILEPILEPFLSPIWNIVSPIYDMIPLTIKTAIAFLLIAVGIYHTVSTATSVRDGLDQKNG